MSGSRVTATCQSVSVTVTSVRARCNIAIEHINLWASCLSPGHAQGREQTRRRRKGPNCS